MNDVHNGLLIKQQCFLKHVQRAEQRFLFFVVPVCINLNEVFNGTLPAQGDTVVTAGLSLLTSVSWV